MENIAKPAYTLVKPSAKGIVKISLKYNIIKIEFSIYFNKYLSRININYFYLLSIHEGFFELNE